MFNFKKYIENLIKDLKELSQVFDKELEVLFQQFVSKRQSYLERKKKISERKKEIVRYCLWYIKSSRLAYYYTTLPIFYPIRQLSRRIYARYKKIQAIYRTFKENKGWWFVFWFIVIFTHLFVAKFIYYDACYIEFL